MLNKDLTAAMAEPLILGILVNGESYGYEIIKQVKQLSNNQLQWKDGMLYPVLHRLEANGEIESIWRMADNGRQRKYYRIKKAGRASLARQKEQWNLASSVLMKIWEVKPCLN